jgi:hypothetical protein
MPYSTDWPERCCEQRITKPVETEQSDPYGRQRERIKDRSRPVCCSSCLLQSQGFVPRALGLWLNRFKQPLDPLHLAKFTLVGPNV